MPIGRVEAFADYLGSPVSKMLGRSPFKDWPVERSVETDLEEPRINYEFHGNGVTVSCDTSERVDTVFLSADDGFDESLFQIPFSLTRGQVLNRFGTAPSRSGEKHTDPILGEYGAWDRFSRPGVEIHVEYCPDADEIRRITLMRAEVAP